MGLVGVDVGLWLLEGHLSLGLGAELQLLLGKVTEGDSLIVHSVSGRVFLEIRVAKTSVKGG